MHPKAPAAQPCPLRVTAGNRSAACVAQGARSTSMWEASVDSERLDNENSERNLTFTVISVAVLSTLAMIAYPILAEALAFDARASGVFLGGTIHDVGGQAVALIVAETLFIMALVLAGLRHLV